MPFDPNAYGPLVSELLALDGNGLRPMPLLASECSSATAATRLQAIDAKKQWPKSRNPKAALSGLWVYFCDFEEAHSIAQDLKNDEGSYWHAILHRMEPDPGNAGYWFRQVGDKHPIFGDVARAASEILRQIPEAEFRCSPSKWDPYAFVAFCERARSQPGSASEIAARQIQLAEWQALFDYCVRPRK